MLNDLTDYTMRGNLAVYTAPAVEPISVTELKAFARIDGTTEDTYLGTLVTAAREACELYLNRALIEQTLRLTFDFWTQRIVSLPRPPLISISGVYTLSEADVATEYGSSYYYAVTESLPGQLCIKQDTALPQNTDRNTAGFRVVYKAGYGSLATNVPQAIREALKLWATAIYETRAMTGEPPPDARALLDLYRVRPV